MRRAMGFVPVAFAGSVALLTALRIAFFFAFRPQVLLRSDIVHAFYLGLKFDARLAALIVFPMLLMRRRRTVVAYAIAALAVVLILYAADFGSYAYIHQRLNLGELEFSAAAVISTERCGSICSILRAKDSAAFVFTTFRDPPRLAVLQHGRWSCDSPFARAF